MNELDLIVIVTRLVSNPMEVGREPVIANSFKFNVVTMLPEQLTPLHSHSGLSGKLPVHFHPVNSVRVLSKVE